MDNEMDKSTDTVAIGSCYETEQSLDIERWM